jgi:hypothetical protein
VLRRSVVLLSAVLGLAPAAAGGQGPTPVIGGPAEPQPIPSLLVPEHPFMAPNGRSNLHNDGFQTDAYLQSGPLGRDMRVATGTHNGLCASVTFDRAGRLVTICVGLDAVTLRRLDPVTLRSVGEFALPRRPAQAGNPFQNFTGGGYFFLDREDRAVVGTADRHLLVIGPDASGAGFELVRDVDLTAVVPEGDGIISILPDWSGRFWVATRNGVVATVPRDGGTPKVLDLKEPNGNSFAVGDDGVYIVTDKANYRFVAASDGTPKVVWRAEYPNDGRRKPGQSQAGSGTTPTLMGDDLVAITSNADPIEVVVHRRAAKLAPGVDRELCRVPVFRAGASSDDQSLVTDGTSLVAENNFGYEGPQSVLGGATTEPGLAKVDVDRRTGTCRLAWTAEQVSAPSAVAKVSLANGLLYTYTKPAGDLTDPWYLTALDWRTGATVWRALAGRGPLLNNNYAPVILGPDGTAYIGVLQGIVGLRDAVAPRLPAPPVTDPRRRATAPARRPAVRVRCTSDGRLRITTADRRVTGLEVRRAGRRVARDTRRPLSVRVRARRGLRAVLTLRDGSRRTVAIRTACGRPRAGG